MPRMYTQVKEYEKEIFEMKAEGRTNREIAEYFGFKDKQVVKSLVKRKHQNDRRIRAGDVPRRKGRPPKGNPSPEREKDNEIKRLKMENELLRDFLRLAGRR